MSNLFTLNQKYNSLTNQILKSTPHSIINKVIYSGTTLNIDCSSLYFLSFSLTMISDITNITFTNAIPNGIYNIFLYTDSSNHTFYKNQGTNIKNTLIGDSVFQSNQCFCIKINYDGINFFLDIQLYN